MRGRRVLKVIDIVRILLVARQVKNSTKPKCCRDKHPSTCQATTPTEAAAKKQVIPHSIPSISVYITVRSTSY